VSGPSGSGTAFLIVPARCARCSGAFLAGLSVAELLELWKAGTDPANVVRDLELSLESWRLICIPCQRTRAN
jgi:hypothetical protein